MAEPINISSKVKKGGTLVTETVITDTTTTIGEIGLTGGAAVDTVKVLSQGATDREALALGTVQAINQQAGANFNQLVGGAGVLTRSAESVALRTLDASDDFFARSIAASDDIAERTSTAATREFQSAQTARASAERQLDRVQLGGESPEDRNKTLMLLVGGVVLAVFATGVFNK